MVAPHIMSLYFLMLDYHSLFKSAGNSTYWLFGGTLKIVKFGEKKFKILSDLKWVHIILTYYTLLLLGGCSSNMFTTVAPPIVFVDHGG